MTHAAVIPADIRIESIEMGIVGSLVKIDQQRQPNTLAQQCPVYRFPSMPREWYIQRSEIGPATMHVHA